MQFRNKIKKRVIINITSLIDVLFLLLIFFMVSSTFLEQPGMKLELPKAKSAEVTRLENLVIYVSADSEIIFNDRPVNIDSLGIILRNIVPKTEGKTLILKADEKVQHGLVIKIMDIAKQAGLKKLVVGTTIESGS